MYEYLDMEDAARIPDCEILLRGESLWDGLDQWLPGVEEL